MRRPVFILAIVLLTALQVFCGEKAHLIVAADGSGSFRTIQEALNSLPAGRAAVCFAAPSPGWSVRGGNRRNITSLDWLSYCGRTPRSLWHHD